MLTIAKNFGHDILPNIKIKLIFKNKTFEIINTYYIEYITLCNLCT